MKTQFSSPKDVLKAMAAFQKQTRSEIEKSLVGIVNNNGGTIIVPLNKYSNHRSVYDENDHCSIMELKSVSVETDGKHAGRIRLVTDRASARRMPHCDNLSIPELLQIWDILIDNINPFAR